MFLLQKIQLLRDSNYFQNKSIFCSLALLSTATYESTMRLEIEELLLIDLVFFVSLGDVLMKPNKNEKLQV